MFLKMVREMGGSGHPAGRRGAGHGDDRRACVDVCVIGGGPAGLGAARAIARAAAGARVALFDEQDAPGGSLHAEPGGGARARALADAGPRRRRPRDIERDRDRLLSRGRGRGRQPGRAGGRDRRGAGARQRPAHAVRDRRLRSEPAVRGQRSPGRDRRARLGRLAFRWGVRPVPRDGRVVILDAAPTPRPLEQALKHAGVEVERVDVARDEVVAALGGKRLRGVEVASPRGKTRTAAGDLVAVATRARAGVGAAAPARRARRVRRRARRLRGRGRRPLRDQRPGRVRVRRRHGFVGTAAAERAGAAAGRALAATLAALAVVFALAPALLRRSAAPRRRRRPPETAAAARHGARRPPASSRRRSPPGRPPRPRAGADARTALRRAILDAAWPTVRDKHYDKTLGGRGLERGARQVRAAGARRAVGGGVLPGAQPDDRRARPVAHADRRPRRRGRRRRRADGAAPGRSRHRAVATPPQPPGTPAAVRRTASAIPGSPCA